ncbi:BQ2448_999 [Microbotryum intermedium]|uniref:BQ2448_999 protein n=1 Tax=Microbotryum intermedium TaxID=269621 RepID=A0A238FCK3_9BASI|nr:BQ2448_999 [Microbotryum intermedium]
MTRVPSDTTYTSSDHYPSHFPSSLSSSSHDDDRLHGQAVHQSVSAAPETSSKHHHHPHPISNELGAAAPSEPSWKGAWARRQAAKRELQLERERKFKHDVGDGEKDGFDPLSLLKKVGLSSKNKIKVKDQRIPVPPIPDLRYEQGILMSIRPFLHRVESTTTTTTTFSTPLAIESETIIVGDESNPHCSDRSPAHQERHEERKEVEEKTAMVSSGLTSEAAQKGFKEGVETDLYAGPLRLEWGNIIYVIFRDQFVYPLLQGLVWGAGGLWLASVWEWNKSRGAASSAGTTRGPVNKGVSPVSNWLAKFGLKARP